MYKITVIANCFDEKVKNSDSVHLFGIWVIGPRAKLKIQSEIKPPLGDLYSKREE